MDIPVSDSLFQDDDFTRVEVQLEPRQVDLLKALASYHETSFDQAVRYLINVGARNAPRPETEEQKDDNAASVFEQFRSIAQRIERLQEKSELAEPRKMHDVLKKMLDRYQSSDSSSRSENASPSAEENQDPGHGASDPPSMFELANRTDEKDPE